MAVLWMDLSAGGGTDGGAGARGNGPCGGADTAVVNRPGGGSGARTGGPVGGEAAGGTAGGAGGRALARALTGRGLELCVWKAAQEPLSALPDDLRGVEAVVVVGTLPVAEDERASRVAGLLDAAHAAELPVLRLDAGPPVDAPRAGRPSAHGGPPAGGRGPAHGGDPAGGRGAAGDPNPADGGGPVVDRVPGDGRAPDGARSPGVPPGEAGERGGRLERFAERVARGRYHARTRAFFTPRAVGWEKRFPDDQPVYRAAVARLELSAGMAVLDAGCGTGRALPLLRDAVGVRGTVFGTDLTPAMVREAARLGRGASGVLAVADCLRLPLGDGVLDGVFAAGLLPHVPEPLDALRELARAVRDGGRLVLFHPVGRAVLAGRHGHTLSADDLLAEPNLRSAMEGTGWVLDRYEDSVDRFLAVGVREKR